MASRDDEKPTRVRWMAVRMPLSRSFVVAAIVGLASCGGGSNPVATSEASVVNGPSPSDTRFVPPCIDLEPNGGPDPIDDPRLDTLRPLGDEPVVQVSLPRVLNVDTLSDRLRPRVLRVPGGMLVSANQFVDVDESFGVLFAVNADGGVRWRRCLDPAPDVVAVGHGNDVDDFLIGWMTVASDGSVTRRFEVWSLSEGRRTRTWDELLSANGISGDAIRNRLPHRVEGSSLVVLGPTEQRNIEPTDSMLILDLSTWKVRTIPYPEHAIGTAIDLIELIVTDNGSLAEIESGSGIPGGRIRAVEGADGWSSAPVDLETAVGTRVDFLMGDSLAQLAGFDSQGQVIWRRDDVFDIQAEGFRVGTDAGIALVSGCSGPSSAEVWCPGPALMAVDVATGETLWQRNGRWAVSVFGDGHALVSGPYTDGSIDDSPPWEMIDLETGERVSETLWNSPWTFGVGCCDSPEEAWVEGGVVFTVDSDSINMWYPKELSTSLQQVAIDSGHRRDG